MPEDKIPYVNNPRDIRDLNENMKLLIVKVNHEQSSMNKDIQATNKKVVEMKEDIKNLKNGFSDFLSTIKGMSLMLKILFGIISLVSLLVGIGAAISGFN